MNIFRNIREVLGGLKREKLAQKLCPKCGCRKLRISSSFDTYPRMFGITPLEYVCAYCGYKGPIAMELEEAKTS
ncbi:MAG: hypothetical protein JSV85_04860 [Candidatus Bathyarchaeota archaeon]|nr:MAG: hypothetical protein JSV85_04860 [Candidatus Bathyarchaeota archaeon]